ncbi:MAG TPA: iron ABC transporter permease [Aggregatilinea sp.]|uniref:FecCD family ABC transporter permease n=1 Tax=Aggregatilinea sp. TaxID=2806333 RepID=UPI002B5A20E7|nr:iron ABC transporter permease [Aggregatilinea sp.]HML21951.1 iron ABC transporter permease [Aggregatilinea sp.]
MSVERRQAVLYILLLVLPLPLAVYTIGLGRYEIAPGDVVRALADWVTVGHNASDLPDLAYDIVIRVRLPRIAAAMLIGGNLAVTGAAFQGIFRNPLVDSNILGVTSGAGFGAALMLLLKGSTLEVQMSAFFFGMLAVLAAYAASRLYHTAPLLMLTLVGIVIGSFFSSLTSLLKYVADPLDALPAITYWLMGGLTSVTQRDLPMLGLISITGMISLWLVRWRLNVLSMGDSEALALGLNPTRLKVIIILFSTLMTAAAVSVGGVIGWVGLVVPHAARTLVGPSHLRLIPATIAMGMVFLLLIDTLSRTMLPGEVPLGVFTGIVGAPLLLIILRVNKTGWK